VGEYAAAKRLIASFPCRFTVTHERMLAGQVLNA
jgi:hypothetical protein